MGNDTHVQAGEQIQELAGGQVDLAVILGSGWAQAAGLLQDVVWRGPITEIAGFSSAQVPGHAGEAVIARVGAATVVTFCGRTHLYEGKGVGATVHPVRAAAQAGCRGVVLTNGCGSTRTDWGPGTIVVLKDHLNLTGQTPLTGPRFVDMSDTYASRIRNSVLALDEELVEGVYAQMHGPQYETPAEVAMARVLGADLVGMSTAVEAIAAKAEGMSVLGMSLVTNLAAGVQQAHLDHSEVVAVGRENGPRLARLLLSVLEGVPLSSW